MIENRLQNEKDHALEILRRNEEPWGWTGAAGEIRKERRVKFLTDEILDPSKIRALEIGCGTGLFTSEFEKKFSNLTAIDISKDLIARASTRVSEKVKFFVADAHALPFESESFDIILGCSVLHHLHWNTAFAEFKRLLKPNGEIRFSEPNLKNPQIYLQKNWPWLKKRMGDSPDEYAFTPNQIRKSLMSLDFKNILVSPFEFLHPSTPKILIPSVQKIEFILEKTFLREIGGSIQISASR